MIFSMNKSDLLAITATPARIASKSLVVHTACVLVTASTDQVTFEATDQTESARCFQSALVEEPGSTLIPANSLTSIIKTLPDEAVTVASGDGSVRIVCGKACFDLPALCPDDFPGFPTVNSPDSVSIPFDLFSSMVKAACLFTAKKNSGGDFLNGIHVEYDGRLKMDATDSYHIIRIIDQSDDVHGIGSFDANIPASFLISAASTKFASDAVLSSSDNQIKITCGNTTLITRTIKESYPQMDRFFDCECNASAKFDRNKLLSAVKRAIAVSSLDHLTMKISDGCAEVSIESQDKGSMREDLETPTRGMCTTTFTPAFLLDSLAAIDSDEVEMVLENPLKPIIVKGGSASCVIMPIRRS